MCAIPNGPADDELHRVAEHHALVYRGSHHDVLARYYRAAKWADADVVMRVTGDCPLINPHVCEDVLNGFREDYWDYASNVEPRTCSPGLDCEVFTFNALQSAFTHSKEREHVTTWMRADFRLARKSVTGDWLPYGAHLDTRYCIDTEDDYKRIRGYFEADDRICAA